MSCRTESKN